MDELKEGDRVYYDFGGTFEVLGVGQMRAPHWRLPGNWRTSYTADLERVVVIRSQGDGRVWVHPVDEFCDGRFRLMPNRSETEVEA